MGASRTGRFAGRRIQPHNFMRPEKGFDSDKASTLIKAETKRLRDPLTMLANNVRSCIAAHPGKVLTISDLAGIEGRILPWECYFTEKLDKIESGLDTYIVAASAVYGVPYEAVTKAQRFVGKVAELSLGYQGSYRALNKMTKAYGLPPFSEADAMGIVYAWRDANQPIVDHWERMEDAAIMATQNKNSVWEAGRILFKRERDFLFMLLPSGRRVAYYLPMIDEEGKLSYMGLNTYTRQWERTLTYGGKLTENATQAIAYDILMPNMLKAERAGFHIVGSVHDELLAEHAPRPDLTSDRLSALLSTPQRWTKGLPLAASGYTAQRYRKD